MTKARLLVAEDDADMRDWLVEVLEEEGYTTVSFAEGDSALAVIARERETIDLVITDVRMPSAGGAEILAAVREHRPEAPVVVITAFGSVAQAVELTKVGAYQYLTKPFETEELLEAVVKALDFSAHRREQARLRREILVAPPEIVGGSKTMRELLEVVGRVATSASTVLLTGESGTGKELVARALHEYSGRKGNFIPVNCAAIPADLIESELFGHTASAFTGAKQPRAGLFEAASGGTLFLDEVGDLPASVQPKLLRALQNGRVRRVGADQEREVDVRTVAATNRDLDADVREGRFREDLYWRLNVIHLRVPALRERPADIPLLVEHFLSRAADMTGRPELTLAPETLSILMYYAWPGNVRELGNTIERAVAIAVGSVLKPEHLPERVRSSGEAGSLLVQAKGRRLTVRDLEREYIVSTLQEFGGNKSRAAEVLGLDRRTLYRKLEEYRAEDPTFEL